MLGELITRVLVLVLGYAYPAFECFKTVEKNRVGIEELRFWCQYWILVAVVTVLERIGDVFVSWLPMYGEMKLALFIYLWYPKTKGSGYVYDAVLKPYMSRHETDIDRNLLEFRARAWDLLVYYWENCTELGQTTFFQVLDYLATHVGKLRQPSLARPQNQETPPAPPTTPPAAPPSPSTPNQQVEYSGGTSSRPTRGGRQSPQHPNSTPTAPPPNPPCQSRYKSISTTKHSSYEARARPRSIWKWRRNRIMGQAQNWPRNKRSLIRTTPSVWPASILDAPKASIRP